MNIEAFKQLPLHRQHEQVKQQGIPLGRRESKRFSIFLFAVYGFYAELYIMKADVTDRCLSVFAEVDKLGPYLKQIDISALFRL